MYSPKLYIYLSFLGFLLHAQSPPTIEYFGNIENLDNEGFDIANNRLYAIFQGTNNSGDDAALLSIVNLTTLEIIATFSPGGYPQNIDVFGNIIVVDGNKFFDVTDDEIQYLGENLMNSSVDDHVMHTHKRGNYLYRIHQGIGFGVYNMTDPLNPVIVHEHDYGIENDYPYGISADENFVFVTNSFDDTHRIHIHNLWGGYYEEGQVDFSSYIDRAVSKDHFLYARDEGTLSVYNIENPGTPVYVNTFDPVPNSFNGEMEIIGNLLFIAQGNGAVLDISNPLNINTIHSFPMSAQDPDGNFISSYEIKLYENRIYVAFGGQANTDNWDGYLGGYVEVYDLDCNNDNLLWGSCYSVDNTIEIDLKNSNLTGSIPSQINNLINLTNLNLEQNILTGEIPSELYDLTNLQDLDLGNNNLIGHVPREIENLTQLTRLTLYGNQFTGSIDNICSLSNLTYVSIASNVFTGGIDCITTLTDLSQIQAWGNEFDGEIPTEIGNLSNLWFIDFTSNNLVGEIPEEISNLTNLYHLELWGNNLTGEIPSSIGDLSNLSTLKLNNNNLTGSIPSSITNLSNLQRLQLYANQLSGSIPTGICDLPIEWNIYVLNDNQFCEEPYPTCVTDYIGYQDCLTIIPDINFEQALIDLGYDDILDGSVLTQNIRSITLLNIDGKNISDMTGIKEFKSLETLICSNNFITDLDISNNLLLERLEVQHNQLNNLDVSNNLSLTLLNCSWNNLTYLNMRNGITDAMTSFIATNNSLGCIETLDPGFASENWTSENANIDEGVIFRINCSEFPEILTIYDVPNDEGGWVYIEFGSSLYDNTTNQGAYTFERLDGNEWTSLHSIDAYGSNNYTTEARTLIDSTATGNGMTSFRVVGIFEYEIGTEEENYGVFQSVPFQGYSVNNITLVGLDEDMQNLPDSYMLRQNYPNPFNPVTTISYDLPEDSNVLISVYDLAGRKIKTLINKNQRAGFHSVNWNGTNDHGVSISSGIYAYIIQSGEFRQMKKMIFLK